MNIGVYYFSGTGLTAHFAEWIASALEKAGHTPSLFRYKEGMELPDPASFDCIGIGAPTYSFYAPRRFLSYLKKIPAGNGKPFFLFHSCHSKQGLTAWGMHRVLKKRGYVSLGESLEMSGINNIRAWRPLLTKKEPQHQLSFSHDLDKWAGHLARLAEEEDNSFQYRFRPLLVLFISLFTYPWMMALVEGLLKRIDKEKCTRCGKCARDICPSGAITMDGDSSYPRIKRLVCVGCSGCVNLCPEGAIITSLSKNRWPFRETSDSIV